MAQATCKTCTECGEAKPHDEFYVDSARKDGRRSRCKACVKAYLRAAYDRIRVPYGDGKHRLISKDPHTMRGECAVCGPVDLMWKRRRTGPPSLRCLVVNQDRQGRNVRSGPLRRDESIAFKAGKACEVCGSTEDLVVDHCHQTGMLRGVLCGRHNRGLGLYRDNPAHMRAAADYIEKYRLNPTGILATFP